MAGRVEVPVAPPYPVVVGPSVDVAAVVSESTEPGLGVIVTDSNVGPLHAASVKRSLEAAGWRIPDVVEIPAGESSKSLEVYSGVVRGLARSGLRRDGTLFALGGGVVGDLGGFAAATYMRGIDLVQLPTSLLAMVDSSVGGKVGLDLPEGKNLVGSFFRPRAVVADLRLLETLPEREVSCGLAEVIKMGLLAGGRFFEDLSLVETARSGELEALEALVLHSVRFKAGVVARDEREAGERAILNYGHTIGHGLEAAAGYALPHGEAISAGMLAAARIAERRLGVDLIEDHQALLRSAGLPVKVQAVETDAVISAMSRDKKRRQGDDSYRFVLLEGVGSPVRDVPVSEDEVRRAIMDVTGP